LDRHVEDLTFGIDGAPQIDHATIDFQIDLVQMPSCMGLRAAFAQVCRDYWSEMVYPSPNGLVGDHNPMLGQQILDVAKAQGEPDIKPDRLLDDFGSKPAGDVTVPEPGGMSQVVEWTPSGASIQENSMP
jgi:hypothetical protein